jgi:hypothetical protein
VNRKSEAKKILELFEKTIVVKENRDFRKTFLSEVDIRRARISSLLSQIQASREQKQR